jgi:PAS domain S-box-containing protein
VDEEEVVNPLQVHKGLEGNDELARLLLNSTGEGIYGVDLNGNCTFANPACLRLLGYDGDADLLGRNMHELVHHTLPNGDPYPMTECRIYKAFREGSGVHVDSEIMWRADGTSFPAEYWSYPMERDGELIGSVLTFVDITDRKLLETRLRNEHARAERLLLNVLPAAIAEQLQARPGQTIAERFDDVTVLFADVVGFTPLSARLSPHEAVEILNEVFTAFDRLATNYGVEKIKTIGDGYMVVAGAPVPRPDHCDAIARMALDMRAWVRDRTSEDGIRLQIRIGINSGSAVGAVVGTSKFSYDLWGDTVNVASRMESLSEPGRIHVADEVRQRLKDAYVFEARGPTLVKGKGTMTTWFLEGRPED